MAVEGISFRDGVLRGFAWQGAGTVIGQVISAVSMILVVRLLSPSDFGLMAMGVTFLTVFTVISELGMSVGLVQAKDLSERLVRQVFAWLLSMALISCLICNALAPWVAEFYDAPDLVAILRVLSVSIIPGVLYVIPRAMLIRDMDFGAKAKVETIVLFGNGLLTWTLAWNGWGVWSLVWSHLAMEVLRAIAFFIARPCWILPLYSIRGAEQLLRYSLTITGDRLLTFVYVEVDTIIVGKFLGANTLGFYSLAKTIASLPLDRVMSVITAVSFPSYSRIQDDLGRIQRNFLRASHAVALGLFPMFFGLAAVAPLALPLLLGPKWEMIVIPFQLLCLVQPLKALTPVLSSPILATGHSGVNLLNMIITSGSMAVALLVGVLGGIEGVCVAWLVAYPVVFGITTIRSLRVLALPLSRYLAEIRFPFIASTLMLALVWLSSQIIVVSLTTWLLVLLVVIGMVFYTGLVMTFQRKQIAEIIHLLLGYTGKTKIKAVLGRVLVALQLHKILGAEQGIVVAFHRVSLKKDSSGLTVSPEAFEKFCRFFQERFTVVSLTHFVERLETGQSVQGLLAITFDDGYRDNYEIAAPILRRLNLPATFFVTTNFIGTEIVPKWDEQAGLSIPWMSWDQVRSLHQHGFEIGAHTRHHVDLGEVDGDLAYEEIYGSRFDLEDKLGSKVHLFAYPFGKPTQLSEGNRAFVKAAGFRCCCSCFGGTNTRLTDPFMIQRVPISPWFMSPLQFVFELVTSKSWAKAGTIPVMRNTSGKTIEGGL